MNQEIFNSMQKQMKPSPEVRAALSEKLAQPVKRRASVRKYVAVAACAALVIGAFPLYQSIQGRLEELDSIHAQEGGSAANITSTKLHSYVVVEGLTNDVQEHASVTGDTGTGGIDPIPDGSTPDYDPTYQDGVSTGGDQDMGMTSDDLTQAMLEVGYTQEEIDEYQSIGYQMTWAKWWKFVGEQRNSEGDDPFNLDNLRSFSQQELYVNTGALPGGAYIGDAPVQEEANNAYNRLLPYLRPHPDWYGGCYIDGSGTLVVCLVESEDPGDKSLELQVLDWAGGRTSRVAFTDVKYSLAHLNELMDQLNALPEADPKCGDVMAGWGIDEEANHIELTLAEVNDHILAVLAELDPEDDAILVQVGQRAIADVGEDTATDSAQTEDPAVHHVMPGGVTVPDVPEDENLIAVEPWVDPAEDLDGAHYDVQNLPAQLPESKRPALVDSAPEEDFANTPSFAGNP